MTVQTWELIQAQIAHIVHPEEQMQNKSKDAKKEVEVKKDE